jgi:type VI secretion system protein ImpE
MLLAQIFRPVIECEMLRAEVFAGKRTPLIFGEPQEWIGLLVQAGIHLAEGRFDAAGELRSQAFDLAPASAGKLNDQPFEWIADADSRLGPLLEVILEGKYYWVPFSRIARIEIEKPVDLRDLIWIPARFTWTNGGAVSAHIPVRYPGSEHAADDTLRLSRQTAWKEQGPDCFVGLGHRILTTSGAEHPLLECRTIELNQ